MNSLEENQKPKTPTMSSEPPAVKILQNYAEPDDPTTPLDKTEEKSIAWPHFWWQDEKKMSTDIR